MINVIAHLITSLIEWVTKKDLYYTPYKPTVLGEHYEDKKTKTI